MLSYSGLSFYIVRIVMIANSDPLHPPQVASMQIELEALMPQLAITSEETAELMVRIEAETVEVEAKKEVVQADEKVRFR